MRRIQYNKPMRNGRQGPVLSLTTIEIKMVAICMQMANIQILLMVSVSIALINSVIKGTKVQEALNEFQKFFVREWESGVWILEQISLRSDSNKKKT